MKNSFAIFSKVFEKVFKMLTGRKLSSLCLSKGETHAVLALSWNILLLKLFLFGIANGWLKTFSFISFGGILSIPVDFLPSIFLKSCSTSRAEIFERWVSAAVRFFSMLSFL